ncbi:hypothetical protein ACSV9I_14125 [Rhizobium sp. G187]|uniref:hypothetical protein n=1 Tax=Rhizobium sp. G187 TaxID=3451352 RepID=UPI003EE4BC97
MKFLQTTDQFKAVALALDNYLQANDAGKPVSELELAGLLLRHAHLPDGQVFALGVQRLASLLNSKQGTKPGRAALLQALSHAFVGETYQRFEARLNCATSLRELFPDAQIPACSFKDGERLEHPFPLAYRELGYLHEWRQVWERNSISTKRSPFIPPMLPSSYFHGNSINYEYRRNWHQPAQFSPKAIPTLRDAVRRYDDGTCCVLVREGRKSPMAGVRWYWWGHGGQINGLEYTMILRRWNKWFFTHFDLRYNRHDPSYGPAIKVIKGDRPDSFVRDILEEMDSTRPSWE